MYWKVGNIAALCQGANLRIKSNMAKIVERKEKRVCFSINLGPPLASLSYKAKEAQLCPVVFAKLITHLNVNKDNSDPSLRPHVGKAGAIK